MYMTKKRFDLFDWYRSFQITLADQVHVPIRSTWPPGAQMQPWAQIHLPLDRPRRRSSLGRRSTWSDQVHLVAQGADPAWCADPLGQIRSTWPIGSVTAQGHKSGISDRSGSDV